MDRRQFAMDYNKFYNPYNPPDPSVSQHDPRLSLQTATHQHPHTSLHVAKAAAIGSTSALTNSYSNQVISDSGQIYATTPSISPTIMQHPSPFQRTSPYLSHATVLPQQMYHVERNQYSIKAQQEHQRQSQASMVHPGIQEARPQNVSNGQSQPPRSSSESFSSEISANILNVIAPFLKKQEEKMDVKFSELLAQVSQVNDKVEKASNAPDETRTGNKTMIKALTHIAQKQQVIVDDMQAIKLFVGLNEHTKRPAYGEDNSGNLYQKLSEITHLVGDWIEKAGDPEANAERRWVDEIRDYQQAIAIRNPSPVRHEMGTSPIPSRHLYEDTATERDHRVRAATTPRVIRHEMAVSPRHLGEQDPTPPLQTSQPSTVHQDAAFSPMHTSLQVQTPPEVRSSPMFIDGRSQKDGEQREEFNNNTPVNRVPKLGNPLSQANTDLFERAASRALKTPTRHPTFKPAVFKHLGSSNGHTRTPEFFPANWKGKATDEDESISTFNPPSASSLKGGLRVVSPDVEADGRLGGPSFARAPRLQKDRSLSELTSLPPSRPSSRPLNVSDRVPMSVSPSRSSTPVASSAASLGYPRPIDEPLPQQNALISPVTSLRSEDEDTVANMILDPPSSSQIEPADEDGAQNEVVDDTGESERSSSIEDTHTPKRPSRKPMSEDPSPLFTQSSRNVSPTVASSCSPPATELQPPSEADNIVDLPAPPVATTTEKWSEPLVAKKQATPSPPADTPAKPPVTQMSPEFIEIISSSVSPPPATERHQPRKSAPSPSPSVSMIEISSDEDDDDVLPQLHVKMSGASPAQVKTEKLDESPPVLLEAEIPVDHPPVSITLKGATPVPDPAPTPEPLTPVQKYKSSNLLDDLLKRQLSPITPLVGEEISKPQKAFDPKKYADSLQDDEDDVVPAKPVAKRPVRSSPRISRGGSQSSAPVLKDKDPSKKQKENQGPSVEKGRAGLLKLSKRKGDNLAATRIKKRKVTKKSGESDEEVDVAPLKKASLRSRSDTVTVTVSAKKSKMELKQEETSSPSRRPRVRPKKKRPIWPEPLDITPGVSQPMIKCDGCPFWFHLSCVAVQPDDVRLKADEIFYCPACEAGVVQNRKNTQVDSEDPTQQFCGRPECTIETNYFLANFIGRRRIPKDSTFVPQYLIKWEGWRLIHATWENPQDLGIDNPEEYVETLTKELRLQGLDVDKDENEYKVILLQEAKDAGWGPNGGHNKRWRAPHYESDDDLQYAAVA